MGRATARLLAQSGYQVLAGVRTEHAAEDLRQLGLSQLIPIRLDVTSSEDLELASAEVSARTGPAGLMALINNAGNNYTSPTEHFDEASARYLFETHFWGMARLTRRMIPLLRRYASHGAGDARILNVGSIGSVSASPFIQFYNAAKFAIMGFTESLRFELAPMGIQTIAILPGAVKTAIWRRSEESLDESLAMLRSQPGPVNELYLYNMSALAKLALNMEQQGVSSEAAAKVFVQALEDRQPALKYFIGLDAKALGYMTKVLPDHLRHAIIRSQLKFRSFA